MDIFERKNSAYCPLFFLHFGLKIKLAGKLIIWKESSMYGVCHGIIHVWSTFSSNIIAPFVRYARLTPMDKTKKS